MEGELISMTHFLPSSNIPHRPLNKGQRELTSVVSMIHISTWLLERGGRGIHTDIHTMLLGRGRSHLENKKDRNGIEQQQMASVSPVLLHPKVGLPAVGPY